MDKNVTEDALELAKSINDGMVSKGTWKIVNVARDSERIFGFDEYPMIQEGYGYKFDETIRLLEESSVIEAKLDGWWFVDVVSTDSYWGKIICPNLTILDDIWWKAKEKGYFRDNQMPEYYFDEHYLYGDQFKGQGPRKSGQFAILINVKALEGFWNKFKTNSNNSSTFTKQIPESLMKIVSFKEETGEIFIDGIKIAKVRKNTDQFELCELVLKNNASKEKTWEWDEILEKWGMDNLDNLKSKKMKVYRAAREVNTKVATASPYNEFFIHTTDTVKLNSIFK